MAGATITITINADKVRAEILAVAQRCGSAAPAMKIIGETVRTSIVKNFQAGGRPSGWKSLSPVTLAKKHGGSILIGQGFAGGLMSSIHPEAGENVVIVGTDKKYGAIHQFGGMAGVNRKVRIPARPFLLVQDEDWIEIKEQLADYIMMGV